MSSASSQPTDESSIWDLLESIESKVIQSIQENTQLILPQLIDKSNQLIQAIPNPAHLIQNHINPSSNNNSSGSNPTSIVQSDHPPARLLVSKTYSFKLTIPRTVIILSGVLLSSTLAAHYWVQTSHFEKLVRAHPTLLNYLPRSIRPSSRRRRRLLNRHRHSIDKESPPELLILLGADPGTLGHQLALHLTQLGYVVFATVSSPDMVSGLELEGLGWLKALVLDPLAPQTSAFTRALAASLSLRFPLTASAETFTHTIHQLPLVGLINCLPVSLPDDLRPVEALAVDQHLIARIHAIAGVSLEVIKVVLPMVRNSIEKFGAEDGLILTLFPTKNTSLALPYLGSSLVANQTLESLMVTLRREIKISESTSRRTIRVVNERIGTFRSSAHFGSYTRAKMPSLPVHLHPIYARSMSRRIGLVGLPTTGYLPATASTGSPLSQLMRRVEKIVHAPGVRTGSRVAVGAETWTYMLVDRLVPPSWVDRWLCLVERLNGWMRAKVMSEVDLESKENLERMIEKRQLSAQSGWKDALLSGAYHHHHPQVEIEVGADTPSVPSPEGPPPAADPAEAPAADQPDPDDTLMETGSVVDKGTEAENEAPPAPDDQGSLQGSFVGSEIDWKEKSA
ncbi:hypothetical protein PCANC_00814 [Puccinia coronata f. sp. avenae]|uniref:DUF1776-domain-containing protein n=1 Tax=Puccinia coronata f. sp. avenae TaxID=200324 RepID=A0A2N5W7Q6_9BASI|nr:hypothetical protein PCANC_00814 [Puccinia coronata f. sp. avenae]